MGTKRLFLIRHAEAGPSSNGGGDHGRGLTDEGRRQARALSVELAELGVEAVLASSAERARETAEALGLVESVTVRDSLYNATPPAIAAALAELGEEVTVAAVVAHAPGIPHLVSALVASSDEDAAWVLERFPAAAAAGIEFEGAWAEVNPGRLFWAAQG